jgi:CTP:molybdopterin cytidylyltransferase MocA
VSCSHGAVVAAFAPRNEPSRDHANALHFPGDATVHPDAVSIGCPSATHSRSATNLTPAVSPALVVLAAGMARRYGGCKPLAPIGPNGEAVIDLLASDGLAAGYDPIVLVLHPESGPAVRYHVERCWPASVHVSFAEQRLPLGTVHAVLAARDKLGPSDPFAVANADDVYSEDAMRVLARQLASGAAEHVLIGYRLRATVPTDDPVTRGICSVDGQGYLTGLTERRSIYRLDRGARFRSADGLVNLWGFQPGIWGVMEAAMESSGLDEEQLLTAAAAGAELPKSEVLLPEMVATMVSGLNDLPVRVVPTDAKLVGVTHAADLPVVSAELSRQVAMGIRPGHPWSGPA